MKIWLANLKNRVHGSLSSRIYKFNPNGWFHLILVIKLPPNHYIKHGGQLVAQALANDSFMLLQASHDNRENEMYV